MHIFIPSTKRHLMMDDGPLSQIPEETRGLVRYVVPLGESVSYAMQLGNRARQGEVLECDAVGIAATRRWIGSYCRAAGIAKFIMMDDDVKFIMRQDVASTKLIKCSPEDVGQMLVAVGRQLDVDAHVGVSARGGNNQRGVGDADSLVSHNTRTLRVLAYRTREFMEMEHGRVEVMEDFDVNLQLLRAGYSNADIGWYAQDQRMTNAPGGCSTYRTHEVHERSAQRLHELHPGLVALRQKSNKTDREGFGTRTEVTISWKKAHLEGQRRKALSA